MAHRHLTRIVTTLVTGALTLTPLTALATGDEAFTSEEPVSQNYVLKRIDTQVEHHAKPSPTSTYATSDALRLTRDTDEAPDAIAELRAYGTDRYTDLDSSQAFSGLTHFLGALEVDVAKVSDTGEQTSIALLHPTVNASQLLPTGDFRYLHADDARELADHLSIECGDVDSDGIDEIFCYTGAYVDEDASRYAIVDMFRSTDGERFYHYTTRVAAGPVDSYPDQATLEAHPEQSLTAAPVVTLLVGDVDGSGALTVTITRVADGTDAVEIVGRAVYTWDGEELVGYGTYGANVQRQALDAPESPRVAEAADHSLTLEWNAVNFGDMSAKDCYYEVSLMRDGDPDHVASSSLVPAQPAETVVRHVCDGLGPNGDYTFCVRAVRAQVSPDGSLRYDATSPSSSALSGHTLAPGERCTADPITSVPASTGAGKEGGLTLSCGGTWTKTVGSEVQDLSPSISFRWLKKAKGDGEWQQISGTAQTDTVATTTASDITAQVIAGHATSTLTLQQITAEDDGMLVRCDLGFGDSALTSNVLSISAGSEAVTTTTPAAGTLRVESSGEPAIAVFEPSVQSLTTGNVADGEHAGDGDEGQGTPRIHVRTQTKPTKKTVTIHRSSPTADPARQDAQDATTQTTTSSTDSETNTETDRVTSTNATTTTPPATDATGPSTDATPTQDTTAPAATPVQAQEPIQAPVPVQTTSPASTEPMLVTPTDTTAVSPLAITSDPSVPSAVVVFLATTGLALVAPHLPKRNQDERDRH